MLQVSNGSSAGEVDFVRPCKVIIGRESPLEAAHMPRGMKRVARDQSCGSYWAKNEPVLRVMPGETFFVETRDRLAEYDGPNTDGILKAMSGPIYIEGVRAGDSIRVEILDIALPFPQGWILTTGRGPLSERIPRLLKKAVRITEAGVVFSDSITIPLRPMISRVGVAPAAGPQASIAKGEFGGAMGNRLVTRGSVVYLPVFHDGAILTIGDGHAAQGDGEATASAVECAVDVLVRVTREERFVVTRPIVTTPSEVMTTGEGPTMEDAARVAVRAMGDLLVDRLGVDDIAAAMLISTAGDVRIGLAGYPPYTMVVAMPRTILSF